MNRVCVVLSAFLVSGVIFAQDAPSKAGSGPQLKAQPKKAVQNVPDTYGTSDTSFHRMGANEFTGMQIGGAAQDLWTDTFYSDGTKIRRYPTVANGWFIGSPHLPSGALVNTVYIEDCVNAANTISGNVYACANDGDGCTSIATISTNPGCGYDTIDVSGANYTVDNSPGGNYLVIRLNLTNTDGSDSIAGAVVGYKLQVSPAPGSATFPDVPTSDFGFQYVEALVSSGITGGCGGGLYCPDGFVTRRQMAIFIAKALGLHFQ
jgi:hypothetical protein